MNNTVKPTFGATAPQTEVKVDRAEAGAIWERQSKKNNSKFMSIKIRLSKERLKELLNSQDDTVSIGFVAFPNNSKNDIATRPDFRIYEDTFKAESGE